MKEQSRAPAIPQPGCPSRSPDRTGSACPCNGSRKRRTKPDKRHKNAGPCTRCRGGNKRKGRWQDRPARPDTARKWRTRAPLRRRSPKPEHPRPPAPHHVGRLRPRADISQALRHVAGVVDRRRLNRFENVVRPDARPIRRTVRQHSQGTTCFCPFGPVDPPRRPRHPEDETGGSADNSGQQQSPPRS